MRFGLLPLVVPVLLSACHHAAADERLAVAPSSERQVAQGVVVGREVGDGAHAWLGVPFAAPPVGDLRWRAPRPAQPFPGGRLEATRFGAVCVQLGGRLSDTDDGDIVGSEDCLTLNVYAPRFDRARVPAGEARLPVMLWIHGGGNTIGTAATYNDAYRLAEKYRVVVVTTNYRLGVLGWFTHPALLEDGMTPEDRSGNFGTLDLMEALRWVQANAGAFGGDPGNVTVFGESAGGIDIYSLLVAPGAKGLFQRAIIQSGLPSSNSKARAANFEDDPEPGAFNSSSEVIAKWLVEAGRAKDRAEAKAVLAKSSGLDLRTFMRTRTPEELLAQFEGASMGMYRMPHVIRDGVVLPEAPAPELLGKPGRYHAVPVLLGTNRDEFKLFMLGMKQFTRTWFGIPRPRDPENYERVASALSRAWRAVGADVPAQQLAAAQPGKVFSYRFDWDEEPKYWVADLTKLLGAAHGMEIALLFQQFENDPFGLATKDNVPGRRELGTAMGSYWTEFARAGAPGKGRDGTLPDWAPFESGFLVLDTRADGGVRMQQGALSLESLSAQLLEAAAGQVVSEDQCRLAAGVYNFADSTGTWFGPDFAKVTGGKCEGFGGYAKLKPPEWR